jgi:hypothetical protein
MLLCNQWIAGKIGLSKTTKAPPSPINYHDPMTDEKASMEIMTCQEVKLQ